MRQSPEASDRSMGDEKSTNPSLRPPLHGYYHDGDGDGSSSCSWVLLDMYPYIADRDNSTSAFAKMSGGGETIRVTLCAAPPPLVSYVCVWCPGLAASEIYRATLEAAESDLLLLRVTLRSSRDPNGEFFVYKARSASASKGACPLLRPLQVPHECLGMRYHIGLLAHSDVAGAHPRGEDDDDHHHHYFVAALCYESNTDETTTTFNLWVYNSTDDKWTASPISLHGRPPPRQLTSKVIVLGQAGGQLAFVDPWRGIVVCDVLGCAPASYLPVPDQIARRNRPPDEPQLSRDVVLVDGRLTLVDLFYLVKPGTYDASCSTWEVSAWSNGVFGDQDWCHDYEVQSRDILIDADTENAGLLPMMKDGEGAPRPTLEGLYIAHPVLSLTESHVVYIMGKVGSDDTKVLLLSVDMRRKKLQAVSMFDGERMYGMFSYTCTQSRIPGYFNLAR